MRMRFNIFGHNAHGQGRAGAHHIGRTPGGPIIREGPDEKIKNEKNKSTSQNHSLGLREEMEKFISVTAKS